MANLILAQYTFSWRTQFVAFSSLVVMLSFLLVSGCSSLSQQSSLSEEAAQQTAYIGVWEDTDNHSRHTITRENNQLSVVSIIDDDGEVFEVQRSEWKDGVLYWTYFVPSTGYIVEHESVKINDNELWCKWKNAYYAGVQRFIRVPENY